MAKILQIFSPTALFKLQTETYPPPLVLGYLEKLLIERGHEVTSIDVNNYSLFEFDKEKIGEIILDKLLQDIEEINPEIILISSWTYGLPFVIELTKRIKGNAKLILGGYNATLYPEETLALTGVDSIFSGNNLIEFAEAVDHACEGTSQIYKQQKEMDINQLPFVDFSSFKFQQNPKKFYLMSSFGCKYKCRFCSDRMIWNGYSSFTAERMIKQIEILKNKYNPLHFAFWESNITMNRKYGEKFLDLYDGSVQWFTYSRLDNLDEKIIKRMAEKNCRYIFLGVEHFDKEILKWYNKTKNASDYVAKFWEILELLTKYKLTPVISLIIGSPYETDESLKNLSLKIDRIKAINPHVEFELSPLTIEIGTQLWNDFMNNKIELFETDKLQLIQEYSGVQPFISKYSDVKLVPQKFLFKNKTMDNTILEEKLIEFILKFHR